MIKRLHELTKAELTALGVFMRGEIKPASITEGSDWVCPQLQRAHFWDEEQIAHKVAADAAKEPSGGASCLRAWVALDGDPVGFCGVLVSPRDLEIVTFLIEASKTEAEQFQVAAPLALESLAGLPDREEIFGWFNQEGFAARFAELCGFKVDPLAPSVIADPNPLCRWYMHPKKLVENIKALSKENSGHLHR